MLLPFMALVAAGCSGGGEADQASEDLLAFASENEFMDEAYWQGVARLSCKPEGLMVCGEAGCEDQELSTGSIGFVEWDIANAEYRRCDSKGCDSYKPIAQSEGLITSLSLPENSLIFRVSSNGQYMEVVPVLLSAYVYHGRCERH